MPISAGVLPMAVAKGRVRSVSMKPGEQLEQVRLGFSRASSIAYCPSNDAESARVGVSVDRGAPGEEGGRG